MTTKSTTTSVVTFTTIPLIPCEKLIGTNYSTWAAAVQLWFQGQGRTDHLTTKSTDVPTDNRARWKQIGASSCNVLWFSLVPNLQAQYQAFTTSYDVGTKAKKVYSNDVHRFYSVLTSLINIKMANMDMQSYLGKLDRLIVEYSTLMPFTSDAETFYKQHGQFFMVIALAGLTPDLQAVHNPILLTPTIHNYDLDQDQLLRLTIPQTFRPSSTSVEDSSALVSHSSYRGGRGGGGCGIRCHYCKNWGHIETDCHIKARELSRSINVAQVITFASNITITVVEYNKLRAANEPASPVTSVAQSSNLVTFVSVLLYWILDS